MSWSREAGAGYLGLSQKRPHWGHRHAGRRVTLSGKSGICCWLAYPPRRRDALAGEAAQGGHPDPQAFPPTIFSKRRPLAWPRSSKKAVSRSPHSGFLQGKEVELGVTQLTCLPK